MLIPFSVFAQDQEVEKKLFDTVDDSYGPYGPPLVFRENNKLSPSIDMPGGSFGPYGPSSTAIDYLKKLFPNKTIPGFSEKQVFPSATSCDKDKDVVSLFPPDYNVGYKIVVYSNKSNISWLPVDYADGYELKVVKVGRELKEEIDLTKYITGTSCSVNDTLEILEPGFYYDLYLRSYRLIKGEKKYSKWVTSTDSEYSMLNGSSNGWRIHYYIPNKALPAIILLLLS